MARTKTPDSPHLTKSPEEKVRVKIIVPAKLLSRMIRLGVYPSYYACKGLEAECKRREELGRLRQLKEKDPRLTIHDLQRQNRRIKRLLGY